MHQQYKNYRAGLLVTLILLNGVFFADWRTSRRVQAAQTTKEQEKALDQKEDELDAIKAKIKAYNQIISLKERQGSTLADQINALEAQAGKLELEINLNKKKLDTLENDVASLNRRIVEKESLINSQKQLLSELMRTYYDGYSGSVSTLIFSTDETLSYLNNEGWTKEVNSKISDMLDSVKTLRESLVGERAIIEEKKTETATLHMQLTERNDFLESAKENKAYLLNKTQAEEKKYATLVDDLEEQRRDIQNEIENIEAGKVSYLVDLPKGNGQLEYPIKTPIKKCPSKPCITQGYGKTSYSGHYASGMHNGIDFADISGSSIYAAADGKVIGKGDLKNLAYGRWLAIDHGNGLITLYAHLSSFTVNKGDKVNKGETIGKMGSTGNSTGSHLHFTVYAAKSYEVVLYKGKSLPTGAPTNPSKYLR
ncbi:MAG: murein hydrolase activator EnvC family protein [Minisyncoccota bacterium]